MTSPYCLFFREMKVCHPELVSGSHGLWFFKLSIMKMNEYFVYIVTNKSNKVLYIGVTNNLERRMFEHKNKMIDGFTKRYNLTRLVYFEETSDVRSAIEREKQLKNWHRDWKIKLITEFNPEWKDLSVEKDEMLK